MYNEDMEQIINRYSCGGVIIHDGKVLVIASPSRATISFPKGTKEPGETDEQTAIREVREESGYNVKIIARIATTEFEFTREDGQRIDKAVTYFLMELADDKPPVQALEESEDFDVDWLSPDEARAQLTFDDAKGVLEKALQAYAYKGQDA